MVIKTGEEQASCRVFANLHQIGQAVFYEGDIAEGDQIAYGDCDQRLIPPLAG